ncbi:MAG: hypothetical protein IJK19_02410 [Bacteroidales bacterium]|nr:hypothetical protein [Bacteroidales bacterium]
MSRTASKMEKMEKKCLECGNAFNGRSDKKFCSDMCRNAYHNRIYRQEKSLITQVNSKLAANRRILENLYSAGVRKVPKNLLEEEKFDFGHYTSLSRNKLGKVTYRCYEFTYYSDLHRNVTIRKD